MKANVCFCGNVKKYSIRIPTVFCISSMFLILISCQKNEDFLRSLNSPEGIEMISFQDLSSDCIARNMTLYYGHEIFRREHKAPVVETKMIENPSFSCFDGMFILKIRNGRDKSTRISSGEIWIDGKPVVRQSDFNKNTCIIIKTVSGLTPESKLEVKLYGTPGSYIDLWIEGTMNEIIPVFEQIGPLCQDSDPPLLPGNSINNPPATGTWYPEVISTSTVGKITYTFTPDEGQCGSVITMEIEVVPSVVPLFNQIDPLIQGSIPPALPLTSVNGVSGTWNPADISTGSTGDYTFTFTPESGQCATKAEMVITIKSEETITDIEGNNYKIVKIGDQRWMADNLRTTRYNNGDLIGTTNPATLNISSETEPEYQWAYGGNENNVSLYGRLYTWYTVADSRGICPTGWHVPSDAEWTTLSDYLINNGYGYEGSGNDIGKSLAAKSGWIQSLTPGFIGNDQESNNSSGFTALPAGYRVMDGNFLLMGAYASWWSSTEYTVSKVWFRFLQYNLDYVTRTASDKRQGGAVRCIKDN